MSASACVHGHMSAQGPRRCEHTPVSCVCRCLRALLEGLRRVQCAGHRVRLSLCGMNRYMLVAILQSASSQLDTRGHAADTREEVSPGWLCAQNSRTARVGGDPALESES